VSSSSWLWCVELLALGLRHPRGRVQGAGYRVQGSIKRQRGSLKRQRGSPCGRVYEHLLQVILSYLKDHPGSPLDSRSLDSRSLDPHWIAAHWDGRSRWDGRSLWMARTCMPTEWMPGRLSHMLTHMTLVTSPNLLPTHQCDCCCSPIDVYAREARDVTYICS